MPWLRRDELRENILAATWDKLQRRSRVYGTHIRIKELVKRVISSSLNVLRTARADSERSSVLISTSLECNGAPATCQHLEKFRHTVSPKLALFSNTENTPHNENKPAYHLVSRVVLFWFLLTPANARLKFPTRVLCQKYDTSSCRHFWGPIWLLLSPLWYLFRVLRYLWN